MNARLHQDSHDLLKNFIPLNTLPSARYNDICSECLVEERPKGTVLFEQGDDAKEFIYLISGMISLYAGEMEMETIVTGSEAARFAVAHHIPRKVKAVTKSKVRIVRIPTHMLDMDRPEDNGQTYMVDEVEDQGGDWMTTMLQSPVFQRLPASNLQKVMMQMEEIAFEAGDVVVKQGDEADYYYIIKSGDCELIRQSSEGARPVKLAELHSCDAFGEDALLSGNPRNVTVKMKGRGQMLRLSKANFISLVKEPVLQYVDFDEGQKKVNAGATWLDVRGADEYTDNCIEGSVNIPFFSLRMKVPELRHDQLQVLVCEKGRTSEAAAFLLLKFGFNALILKGGMANLKGGPNIAKPHVEAPKLELAEEISHKVNAPSIEQQSDALLEAAQDKVLELERLCAQLNEKLNTLELERNDLRQQNDQEKALVAELKEASQKALSELEVRQSSAVDRELESQQEREKTTLLEAEIERQQLELSQLLEETSGSRESLSAARAELASIANVASEKDDELAANVTELSQLKAAIRGLKEQENDAAAELSERLALAHQQLVDLKGEKDSLEKHVVDAREKEGELLRVKADLETQIDEIGCDADAGLSEKEEGLQALTAEVSEMRSDLSKAEASLDDVSFQLEQAKVNERAALEKHQESARLEIRQLEEKLSVAQDRLDDTSTEFSEQQARADKLDGELSAANEMNQNNVMLLQEKQREMGLFEQKLSEVGEETGLLEQQKNDLTSALSEKETLLANSSNALEKSQCDLLELEGEAGELREQVASIQSSLDAVALGKEAVESDLIQRLSSAEESLVVALDEQSVIEQSLATEVTEKERAQESLSELNAQLVSGLDGQQLVEQQLEESRTDSNRLENELQQLKSGLSRSEVEQNKLIEQLSQMRQEVEDANGLSDNIKAELLAQTKVELDGKEAAWADQVKQLEETHDAQVMALNDTVESTNNELLNIKTELTSSNEENSSLKQKAVDVEAVLSATSGDQKALLEQLDGARTELGESKGSVDSLQLTSDELSATNEELKQNLVSSQGEYGELQAAFSGAEERCERLTEQLSALSSNKETEGGALKDQLIGLEGKLASAEQDNRALSGELQAAQDSAALAVTAAEKASVDVSQLKQDRLSSDNDVKSLQQKIESLELVLQSTEEEKNQFIVNADNEQSDEVNALSSQLLAAQEELKPLLLQLDEFQGAKEGHEQEKAAMEEQLTAARKSNDELKVAASAVKNKSTGRFDSGTDQARIKELEEQLDESNSALMDLEIQMETSRVDVDEGPSEEEANKLKAIQSELDLVREQTEKDVQAMQVKFQNSEKMNLALKKKILSMQTLANENIVPESEPEPTPKKKGWW